MPNKLFSGPMEYKAHGHAFARAALSSLLAMYVQVMF